MWLMGLVVSRLRRQGAAWESTGWPDPAPHLSAAGVSACRAGGCRPYPLDTTVLAGPCARVPVEHADFIRQVLDRVGDKWTLMVIASLRGGLLRYTDLQRGISGISQRMLSRTLAQLPTTTATP